MLHFHSKDRSSLIFQMLQRGKYYWILFNQHKNKNYLHYNFFQKLALNHFCMGPDPLLFQVCGPFWKGIVSVLSFLVGQYWKTCFSILFLQLGLYFPVLPSMWSNTGPSRSSRQLTLWWQHQEIYMVRRAILEELNFNIILFSNWECTDKIAE